MSLLVDAVKALAIIVPIALGVRCSRAGDPAIRPCPAGWYVNGVTPAGLYRCRPVLGDPERDIADAVARIAIEGEAAEAAEAESYGLLYCTGGSTPRHDGSRVWCDR